MCSLTVLMTSHLICTMSYGNLLTEQLLYFTEVTVYFSVVTMLQNTVNAHCPLNTHVDGYTFQYNISFPIDYINIFLLFRLL
jgi:hypothetical protein